MPEIKKVTLDIDDGSVFCMDWDIIQRLVDRYPNFKMSVFFVPFAWELEKSVARIMRKQALDKFEEFKDHLQLIPHGLTHMDREFENCTQETMEMSLKAIDEAISRDNLPYEKGFKAPFWLYNQSVVDVLDEHDWWMAVDRNQPHAHKTKRFFEYNWSIDEKFWESSGVWKLHGHMTPPSKNNLNDCFLNLLKIPLNAEWHFVTDYLEAK